MANRSWGSFLSGCVFFTLAVTGLRKTIADAIPRELAVASSAGIGLFLAFVGLKIWVL